MRFDLLERRKHLGVAEKILLARSLAATPDERWRRHQTYLRSHGLLKASRRAGSASSLLA
jgi:hypothetical protein